jgi:predicted RNase H-like HicB family nuclease
MVFPFDKGIERNMENFTIETEQETDGRWIAEVMELPGTLVYGESQAEAIAKVQALALRVMAERLETEDNFPALTSIAFATA